MRRLSFIALFGTIAILIGGCGGGEEETVIAPAPTTPATEPTPQQTPTQPFSSPMVDPKQTPQPTPGATAVTPPPNVTAAAPSELIPPTDPNQRTIEVQKQIDQANRDPFGLPPLELNPQQPESTTVNRTPTQTPNRAIPNFGGIPAAQPPVITIPGARRPAIPPAPTTPTARNVPTVAGVPATQAPVLNVPRTGTPRPPARNGVTTTPQRTAQTTQRPTTTAQRPQTTQRPATTAQRPQTTQRPTTTAQRPQTTQRPATTAQRPQTTQRPATTAQRPQTTQRPATTARRPQTTQTRTPVAAAPAPAPTPAIVAPPPPPEIPTLPPPPDPILAKAVEVSGVVVVGTEPQAIIKAPNEATSRYVRTGQRLANGQVLVKRIEFNEGSEPIVILEQNGVEVAKIVGERPAAPVQPGTQAANPALTTANGQKSV